MKVLLGFFLGVFALLSMSVYGDAVAVTVPDQLAAVENCPCQSGQLGIPLGSRDWRNVLLSVDGGSDRAKVKAIAESVVEVISANVARSSVSLTSVLPNINTALLSIYYLAAESFDTWKPLVTAVPGVLYVEMDSEKGDEPF